MKHWLFAIALICLGSTGARAGAYNTVCKVVTISNVTPTELTGNISLSPTTVAPAAVWAVKITNLDATADLFSSQSATVATSGASQGEQIAHASAAPWNWLAWIINSSKDWYAISNGGAPTRAEVCLTQ